MPNALDTMLDEAIIRGRQQGLEQGHLEGRRDDVREVLRAHFGAIPRRLSSESLAPMPTPCTPCPGKLLWLRGTQTYNAMQRQPMHFDTYLLVVARWNGYLTSRDACSRAASLGEYPGHLLNVYERLDGLEREVGTGLWPRSSAAGPGRHAFSDTGDDAAWALYANLN